MKEFLKNWGILILVLAAILLARVYVFTPVTVNGHSMDPTLSDGQRLISSKISNYERMDIITTKEPGDEERMIVKRIIGMPGDRYSREGNNLVITVVRGDQEISYTVLLADDTAEQLPTAGLIQLGEYFVIGDAIYGSFDSRNLGFIAHSDVRGIVRQVF